MSWVAGEWKGYAELDVWVVKGVQIILKGGSRPGGALPKPVHLASRVWNPTLAAIGADDALVVVIISPGGAAYSGAVPWLGESSELGGAWTGAGRS
jgi:hypothetical protein